MTGPAINGGHGPQPYSNWFNDFVRNEDFLLSVQEPYSMRLREHWEISSRTHNFAYLSVEEMQALQRYSD